jgi:hypothetical protein
MMKCGMWGVQWKRLNSEMWNGTDGTVECGMEQIKQWDVVGKD